MTAHACAYARIGSRYREWVVGAFYVIVCI